MAPSSIRYRRPTKTCGRVQNRTLQVISPQRTPSRSRFWNVIKVYSISPDMLGFDVSERTISRWMKRTQRNPDPAKRWLTFLRNHKEAIAAMDFFTVPTVSFGLLYCFFIISHDRRRILHFNVTKHPTTQWIIQQLREAFPFDSAPRFLIFDRDAKYGLEVPVAIRFLSIRPVQTSFESPWQMGSPSAGWEAAAATCWIMSLR